MVGLKIATAAANMAITMGLSYAIQEAVQWFDDMAHSAERASEEAENALSKATEERKKTESELETLSELIQKYKDLKEEEKSSGVSKRSELLQIQNQITEAVGSQANNLDLVNGKLEEELQKYKEISKEIANQNLKNAMTEYVTAKDAADKAVGQNDYGYEIATSGLPNNSAGLTSYLQEKGFISGLLSKTTGLNGEESLSDLSKFVPKLSEHELSAYVYRDFGNIFGQGAGFGIKLEGSLENKIKYLEELQDALIGTEWATGDLWTQIASQISQYKETSEKIDTTIQSALNSVIAYYDASNTYEVDSLTTYSNYRDKLIQNIEGNGYLKDFINNGDIDNTMIQEYVDTALSIKFPDFYDQWEKSSENIVQTAEYTVDKLSAFKELMSKDNSDNNSDFLTCIDEYTEKISTLKEVLENVLKGDFSNEDFISLVKQFPELANESNNLESAIISLIDSTKTDIIADFEKQANNMDTQESVDAVNALKNSILGLADIDISFEYSAEVEGLDNLYSAIKESVSGTGLTDESIENIKNRYKNLSNYNAEALFEKTANGIHLNTKELRELEQEYQRLEKQSIDDKLEELKNDYAKVTDEIYNCKDATQLIELYRERSTIVSEIDNVSTLASQYEGLTSAYNTWINAQSSGEEGDMYDNIRDFLEDAQNLYDEGLVGTNAFREYIDLLSNKDLSAATPTEIREEFERLQQTINGTSYKATDFLAEGSDGVLNFLHALQEVNPEWAKLKDDGTWELDIDNDKAAEKLGIDVEFLETMLRKLTDYEWFVNLKGEYSNLKPLDNTELTLENINSEISDAKQELDSFKDSNGKVNIKLEGAEEAQNKLETLLKTKQALINQQSGIYDIDTDISSYIGGYDRYGNVSYYKDSNNRIISKDYLTKAATIYGLIESLNKNINDKNINLIIGADTTQADNAIDALYENFQGQYGNETSKKIMLALGLDTSSKEKLLESVDKLVNSEDFQDKISELGLKTTAIVNTEVDDTEVKNYEEEDKNTVGTVYYHADYSQVLDNLPPTLKAKVELEPTLKSNGNPISNIASFVFGKSLFGTSNAIGSNGNAPSGIHLGGEIGEELVSFIAR